MKTILVPIDFSEITERVIRLAAEIGQGVGATICLLHVAEPEPDFVGLEVGPQHVRDQKASELRSEHREIQERVSALRADGLEAHALLVQGATVEKILAEAHRLGAGLIVMGSHGRGGLRRALVGSVSEGVLHRAPCPVLIVPQAKSSC